MGRDPVQSAPPGLRYPRGRTDQSAQVAKSHQIALHHAEWLSAKYAHFARRYRSIVSNDATWLMLASRLRHLAWPGGMRSPESRQIKSGGSAQIEAPPGRSRAGREAAQISSVRRSWGRWSQRWRGRHNWRPTRIRWRGCGASLRDIQGQVRCCGTEPATWRLSGEESQWRRRASGGVGNAARATYCMSLSDFRYVTEIVVQAW